MSASSPDRGVRRTPSVLPFLLLILLPAVPVPRGAPASLAAQDTVVEEQLPLDSAGTIHELDPDLRSRLGLFEQIEGYESVRLFRLDDGRTVLEISYREEGRLLRERRYLEPDVLEALRSYLVEQIALMDEPSAGEGEAGQTRTAATSREGRSRLIVGQTALGLGYHGFAVPAVMDLSGDRSRVAAYLLTSGASFLVPYLLTREGPVTDAHGRMAWWGGSRGILYGHLGATVATGEDDYGSDGHLAAGLATSLLGSYLGWRIADRARMDEGAAALWATMGDLGTLAGFGGAYAAGFYDEELVEQHVEDPVVGDPGVFVAPERTGVRSGHLATLVLTAAGIGAGHLLGGRDDYTVGDTRALRSAAGLGAQLALPLAELVAGDEDRSKAWAAASVLGGAAGVWGGSELLRGRSVGSGEGLILNAGQLAGTLGALGVTWLLVPDDTGNELLFSTAAAVGGAAGLALTWAALEPGEGELASGLSVELRPAALLAGLAGWAPGRRTEALRTRAWDHATASRTAPPVVTVRF